MGTMESRSPTTAPEPALPVNAARSINPTHPEKRSPSWNLVLCRFLNFLLYINFCVLVGSGLLLWLRLPPRRGNPVQVEMLGLGRHEWGTIHSWVSALFIGLIVGHLILHRKWLMTVVARKHPSLLWGGLLTGIVILLFFILLPVA
jgi:uncharacterized BrkB/YihY/UPF0761 family membrane protein